MTLSFTPHIPFVFTCYSTYSIRVYLLLPILPSCLPFTLHPPFLFTFYSISSILIYPLLHILHSNQIKSRFIYCQIKTSCGVFHMTSCGVFHMTSCGVFHHTFLFTCYSNLPFMFTCYSTYSIHVYLLLHILYSCLHVTPRPPKLFTCYSMSSILLHIFHVYMLLHILHVYLLLHILHSSLTVTPHPPHPDYCITTK